MDKSSNLDLDQKGSLATAETVLTVAQELKKLGLIDKSISFGWNMEDMNVFFEVNGHKHRVSIKKVSEVREY